MCFCQPWGSGLDERGQGLAQTSRTCGRGLPWVITHQPYPKRRKMNGAEPQLSAWLYKLGGGKSEGSQWNRRYFLLHGSVLQYFKSEGALPAERCRVSRTGTVSAREESAAADGSLRWGFSLVHPCGDTLVLA